MITIIVGHTNNLQHCLAATIYMYIVFAVLNLYLCVENLNAFKN